MWYLITLPVGTKWDKMGKSVFFTFWDKMATGGSDPLFRGGSRGGRMTSMRFMSGVGGYPPMVVILAGLHPAAVYSPGGVGGSKILTTFSPTGAARISATGAGSELETPRRGLRVHRYHTRQASWVSQPSRDPGATKARRMTSKCERERRWNRSSPSAQRSSGIWCGKPRQMGSPLWVGLFFSMCWRRWNRSQLAIPPRTPLGDRLGGHRAAASTGSEGGQPDDGLRGRPASQDRSPGPPTGPAERPPGRARLTRRRAR